ncbi:MAG TPA: epoxide hydrolase [Micropepsaceae bacterium]|nr:epoxide hydrolase [Micropepsaceae bacterium]
MRPERFDIRFPDAALADLKARLSRTRLPNEPDGNDDWRWGTNLSYMASLIAHWRDRFDWRAAEARLNRFAHFRVHLPAETGETLSIHFIHEKGSGKNPRPLILTHGWPSTFREFTDVIERLAHPERFGGNADDGFDVIVPSLPGFGLSAIPQRPLGPYAIAHLWHLLMHDVLGHETYLVQAGDWGAAVSSLLARRYPDEVRALHLTMLNLRPELKHASQPPLSPQEKAWIAEMKAWWAQEEGYRVIQGTKPMALAYALMDSPAGLAAWLGDKYWRLGDTKKDHASRGMIARFPHHIMCEQMSLYWLTGTINAANTIYKQAAIENRMRLDPGERITVPTAYTEYPIDTLPDTPEEWGRRMFNIVRWVKAPAGGHFAAMEEPEWFADDVRTFFRTVR